METEMLKLKLIRENVHDNEDYTRGSLFNADTDEFLMYTLEDRVRDYNKDGDLEDEGETKVFGETAIPYGTYGGFLRYSPRRKRIVPELIGVKHFQYIQIHSGNNIGHTLGCILVGYRRNERNVWMSREAERDLVELIEKNDKEGNFKITIV